jgi:hypothetical protein
MKTPVCWHSLVFLHVHKGDVTDEYRIDVAPGGLWEGRLVNERSSGCWLAYLNGVCGSASPTQGACERDTARAALDDALGRLERRVNSDQAFLYAFESL